ncbi:MAG: DUF1559 domain-containing protein [Pirellulaceae bacterium]
MNPHCLRRRYSGLTLVELLVALFLVGVLVALLIPAIQWARESARRMQCQNHQRQWGIAVSNYEGVYREFPPSSRAVPVESSAITLLLPYVEGSSVAYDLDFSWSDLENRNAVSVVIPFLQCPSSPSNGMVDYSYSFGPATGDYAPAHGVAASYCALAGWPTFAPPDFNGILTPLPCSTGNVTDGLSQTVLFVEDAGRPYLWRMGRQVEGIAKHGAWANPEYEVAINGSDRLVQGSGEGGGTCIMNCTNDNETYSFHPGGANLLFGDGSVHFVSQQIEPRVFAAMITRASSDLVTLPGR